MSDQYTVTTRNSWGSRIRNSFSGILFGIILIPLALWGLWWNEGRPDLSEYAKESVAIDGSTVDTSVDGTFVSLTGKITSDEELGDAPYFLPGAYITLSRSTEMYAWVQKTETKEEVDNVGGGSTTTTTYTYTKEWTSSPADSSSFEYPSGHENPSKTIDNASFAVTEAKIDAYTLYPSAGVEMPGGSDVNGDSGELPAGYVKSGKYIFTRDGAQSSPQVGDERISYSALRAGTTVTALGSVTNGEFTSYMYKDKHEFFRVFVGTRNDALETLHTEFLIVLWLIRVFGILGIYIGLQMLVSPIARILEVLRIVGSAFEGIAGFINFFVALTMGISTIIISKIFHNIYILAFLAIVLIAGVIWYLRKRSAAQTAATPVAAAAVAGNGGTTPVVSDAATNTDVDNSPPKMT